MNPPIHVPEKPMRHKVFALVHTVLILTALSACDNVEWGGVDLAMEASSDPSRWNVAGDSETTEEFMEPLELGPVLYMVDRRSEEAVALPIAELSNGEYRPLPSEGEVRDFEERFIHQTLAPGDELVLFHQGRRAGTFLTDTAREPDGSYCRARPRVQGDLELREGAASAQLFLALAKGDHPPFHHAPYGPMTVSEEDDSLADALATRLLTRVEAPWPPSVPEIRRNVQVLPLGQPERNAIAGSFIYDDVLEVGAAPSLAYSLFFLAAEGAEEVGYETLWYWYQRQADGGKAWPSLVGSIAWSPEGEAEDAVLEVFGEDTSWFAVVGTRDGTWDLLFQDPCAAYTSIGRTGTGP